MSTNPKASPKVRAQSHAWDRARALGYEAASTGAVNHYGHGTQCWMAFEQGKKKAIESIKAAEEQKP